MKRWVAFVDDNYTGKEIPEGKAKLVKIEIDGVMRELDVLDGSAHFQSLKVFWNKGTEVGAGDTVVRPIKSAKSVARKATKATTAAKTTKGMTVTTVESRARVWAQDNGASGLPPRLPREVVQAFKDKNPDLIPERFIKPVVVTQAKPTSNANLNMTEGKTTRVKKSAQSAPAFKEAQAG